MKPINFTDDYKAKYQDSNIVKSTPLIVPAANRGIYHGMTKLQYLSCFKKQKNSIGSNKLNEKKTSSLGGVLKSESNLSIMRNKSTRHKVELGRRSTLPISAANVVSANTTDISNVTHERVQKILRLFQMTYDHFLKEGKGRPKSEGNRCRPDIRAAQVVEEKFGRCLPSIGAIPGVKIGEKFKFRAELALVGLHMPLQSGIGTNFSVLASPNQHRLCTSVVATSRRWYENDMNDPNYIIYSGHGGFGKEECEDQKLLRGNKALMNSKIRKNEVRVIRTRIENGKQVYVYDGLYLVEECFKVRGISGKLVFKFGLKRIIESK